MWTVSGLVASSQNMIYYCRGKKKKRRAETFTESPRNHLSLLLVSSIWCAIQPGAIQINTRGGSLRDWTPNGGGREADSDTFQMFYD